MFKLGFCFLIYKGLSQQALWHDFFYKANPSKFGIYCHSKYPKKTDNCKFLKNYLIDDHIKTSWGSPSLVEATINLFKSAIDDGCDYVILLSGSCIPIHSFNFIYNKLSANKSILNFDDGTRQESYFEKKETLRRFNKSKLIDGFCDKTNFIKSEQWLGLTKRHVDLLDKKHLKYFKDIFASDEHYIPTLLAKKNELQNCHNQAITYTDWENNLDWRHPVKFKRITDNIISDSRSTGALFLRKAGNWSRAKKALKNYKQKDFKIPKDKKYIAFIHIPKNGGCSVKSMFENDLRFFNFSHMTALDIKNNLGYDLWEECFSFTFVRNPWARALSAFNFLQKGGLPQFKDEEKALQLGISPDSQFNDWVIKNRHNFLNKKFPFAGTAGWMHFKKQTQYYNCSIDKYFKLEEIHTYKEFSKLPKKNACSHQDYQEVYNAKSASIISEAYEDDILSFDYKFFKY